MNKIVCLLAMFGALASLPAGDAAAVEGAAADAKVQYKKGFQLAEESADAVLRKESAQRLRRALEQELRSVAPVCLGKGQLIEVSMSEINSAGAVGSTRGAPRSDVRVVKNSWVVWLLFDYRLLDAEQKVIDQGSANLRNSGFVGDDPTERIPTDAFPKERALLTEWFKAKYCAADQSKSR
jgi:hypothetical protein